MIDLLRKIFYSSKSGEPDTKLALEKQQDIAVSDANPYDGWVGFWADRNAAEEFSRYGRLHHHGGNEYTLVIDARYPFWDVVKLIDPQVYPADYFVGSRGYRASGSRLGKR